MADAGRLACATGAGRVEPFHFSARYAGQEARLLREVDEAFHAGEVRCSDPPPLGSSGRTG